MVPEYHGATLAFVHGLGGIQGELLSNAAVLARYRFGALLLDLRNHGHSHGKMAPLGYAETEDVRGAVKFFLSRPEVMSANPAEYEKRVVALLDRCPRGNDPAEVRVHWQGVAIKSG